MKNNNQTITFEYVVERKRIKPFGYYNADAYNL